MRFLKSKIILLIILLILVLLALLPAILNSVAVKIVADNKIGDANIGSIDINIFTGELILENLVINRNDVEKLQLGSLSLDIDWLELTRGEVSFKEIAIDNVTFSATEDSQGVWEILIPIVDSQAANNNDQSSKEKLLKLAVERMALSNVNINVDSSLATGIYVIDKLDVSGLGSWGDRNVDIQLNSSWNNTRLSMVANVNLDIKSADYISSQIKMKLSVDEFLYPYNGLEISTKSIDIEADIDGEINNENMDYVVSGNVDIKNFRLVDSEKDIDIVDMEKFLVNKFKADNSQQLMFDKVRIDGLNIEKASSEAKGLYYHGQINIDELVYKENIDLLSIQLTDLQYRPVLDKNGELSIQQLILSTIDKVMVNQKQLLNDGPAKATSKDVDDSKITLTLDQLSIVGESFVHFSDQRLASPFEETVVIKELRLNNFNQAEPNTPAYFSLLGGVGEFSTIAINGDLKLFAEKPAFNLNGDIKSVDLNSLSTYSETYLGYGLKQGQLDYDFIIELDNDVILSKNNLFLRKLKIEPVNNKKGQLLDNKLSVPLGVALNMLRDGDDNIELDMPINAKLDGSDIDASGVITEALSKSLRKGATSYLKYALQPYGAALIAAEMVGDKLSSIRLEPIIFDAADDSLSDKNRDYLDKLSLLMIERPKLTISICGIANDGDKEALMARDGKADNEDLLSVARQRGLMVKRQLSEKGVANNRLLLCQPSYEADFGGVRLAI